MKRDKDGRPSGRPESLTPVELEILRTLRRLTPSRRRRALDLLKNMQAGKGRNAP